MGNGSRTWASAYKKIFTAHSSGKRYTEAETKNDEIETKGLALMVDQAKEKELAGKKAAELVEDGMTLGLGTGSTVECMLYALGDRVKAGLKIKGVPTSERTAALCHKLGIELVDFFQVDRLDLAIDGADEIDVNFQMTKGGGGALLREKIVAEAADKVAIMVDSTKLVDKLGAFPLPVEIVKFGHPQTEAKIRAMGIDFSLRSSGDDPYSTDNGNYILDCKMGTIDEQAGVVDTGLFIDLCDYLVIGTGDVAEIRNKP